MAATLLAERITTWRRTESRLRTLRVSGNGENTVAAITRAKAQLVQLAHALDLSGHAAVATCLDREAVLAPMVKARRTHNVPCPDLAEQLRRARAIIRAAR